MPSDKFAQWWKWDGVLYKQTSSICKPKRIRIFALIINCTIIMKTNSRFSRDVYAISNYNFILPFDINTHSYHSFNGDLTKPPLNWWHGWTVWVSSVPCVVFAFRLQWRTMMRSFLMWCHVSFFYCAVPQGNKNKQTNVSTHNHTDILIQHFWIHNFVKNRYKRCAVTKYKISIKKNINEMLRAIRNDTLTIAMHVDDKCGCIIEDSGSLRKHHHFLTYFLYWYLFRQPWKKTLSLRQLMIWWSVQ